MEKKMPNEASCEVRSDDTGSESDATLSNTSESVSEFSGEAKEQLKTDIISCLSANSMPCTIKAQWSLSINGSGRLVASNAKYGHDFVVNMARVARLALGYNVLVLDTETGQTLEQIRIPYPESGSLSILVLGCDSGSVILKIVKHTSTNGGPIGPSSKFAPLGEMNVPTADESVGGGNVIINFARHSRLPHTHILTPHYFFVSDDRDFSTQKATQIA